MATAPSLFLFSSFQIGVHLGLTLGIGKLLGFTRRDLLLASNANVGGMQAMIHDARCPINKSHDP